METRVQPAPFHLDRRELADRYRHNRERTARVFDLVRPEAFYENPIPLRHPFAFYAGHIPGFSFLTLNERGLGEAPVDPRLEKLFERGIDPGSIDEARRHERADWPAREAIDAFAGACDERVLAAIAGGAIDDARVPRLVRAQAVYAILEHEEMHDETLAYIVHRLPAGLKERVAQDYRDHAPPRNDLVEIAAGDATLGVEQDEIPFAWDNESGRHTVPVKRFAIARYPVTNADWLAFVAAGGPIPAFWIEHDGDYRLRGMFEDLPMPGSWPVYVSHAQARAYASWAGMRLPTEAEYHRAAFSTREGGERAFPWGDEPPEHRHGNFDFQRYDTEPVDAHPGGASDWGVHDLTGNGWEWTSTVFAPFPNFEPSASYPQYSADFFDGKHYVMKGASPVTPATLIRRSFRNWFFEDYPFMFAKFRCAADR